MPAQTETFTPIKRESGLTVKSRAGSPRGRHDLTAAAASCGLVAGDRQRTGVAGNPSRIAEHFARQAEACRRLGSPFTAALLDLLLDHLERRSPIGRALQDWPGDPREDALALRLAGGLHALVLSARAPALAAAYPGAAAAGDRARLRSAVPAALEAHTDFLIAFLERPPQTNEVARAAMLLPGFLTIAADAGLPLALLELGASAGLNLHWDAYHYRLGEADWGPEDSPVRLAPEWRGRPPPLLPKVAIESRAGCDAAPLDPGDEGDRLRLRAYVWADQTERLERLARALEVAALRPTRVEQADAASWLEARLATPAPDAATVVYHSIVWQYLGESTKAQVLDLLAARGRQAKSNSPLYWLRMEPASEPRFAELRLTAWPSGRERLLARNDFHGRWIEWFGQADGDR